MCLTHAYVEFSVCLVGEVGAKLEVDIACCDCKFGKSVEQQ